MFGAAGSSAGGGRNDFPRLDPEATHHGLFVQHLREAGVDPDRLLRDGRLTFLDAAATLSRRKDSRTG